jgi:hypothetical protein
MKSINKTKDLWNHDLKLSGIESNRWGPLCCWYWCWWVMNRK